jgi:peptidoglycan/xylan/chitin deacetylase (PgdA/CDA1 family)
MTHSVSSLWLAPPLDITWRIERCLGSARDLTVAGGPGCIFFRADDVAAPGKNLARLMEIFERYRVPLSLAVVPAWLTRPRWEQLKALGQKGGSLWCWHQHGWRHMNHEGEGKKQEFGQSRGLARIREDIIRGRNRLEMYMEKDFFPVFTPPWNRCGSTTLELLKEFGYHAVSRSKGSHPPTPAELPDFQVNVDLHTRKELGSDECWNALFAELKLALLSSVCGIMIHHQRMNDVAFDFLELLIQAFSRHKGLCLAHFGDLV